MILVIEAGYLTYLIQLKTDKNTGGEVMFQTLLVDDDFLVRSYLKTLDSWEKVGYEVVRHDDFEYVKEAMWLGADEYILKNTLDENSLLEVLEKAKAQIEVKKAKTTQEKHTKKLIQMGSHTLKYHFFNGVLSQTLEGEVREQKRLEAELRVKLMLEAEAAEREAELQRMEAAAKEAEAKKKETVKPKAKPAAK